MVHFRQSRFHMSRPASLLRFLQQLCRAVPEFN
jgi:hypothetical protein